MIGTALEFAPGTSEPCKRVVVGMFGDARLLLGAYKNARHHLKTPDVVILTSVEDPSNYIAESRLDYLGRLRRALGKNAPRTMPQLGINKAAQAVVKVPREMDAFWLVVTRGQDLPLECVLFTTPYEAGMDVIDDESRVAPQADGTLFS